MEAIHIQYGWQIWGVSLIKWKPHVTWMTESSGTDGWKGTAHTPWVTERRGRTSWMGTTYAYGNSRDVTCSTGVTQKRDDREKRYFWLNGGHTQHRWQLDRVCLGEKGSHTAWLTQIRDRVGQMMAKQPGWQIEGLPCGFSCRYTV